MMTNLTVQYESNIVDGGSKSPIYRVQHSGTAWRTWDVLSASIPTQAIQPIIEPSGVLALYALGGDGRVYRLAQFHPSATLITWNGWYGASAPPPLGHMQVAIVNRQIAIVGLGLDRKAYVTYLNGGTWADWMQLGGTSPPLTSLAAVATGDNRLVVCGVLYDDSIANRKVHFIEQTAVSSASWSAWHELGTSPAAQQAKAIATADSRLAVFAIDSANQVQYIQQTAVSSPGAAWGAWGVLSASPAVQHIVPFATPDSRIIVFAIDDTDQVQSVQQTSASSPTTAWSAWTAVGGVPAGVVTIAPGVTADSHLVVFAVEAARRTALTIKQTSPSAPTAVWEAWEAVAASPSLDALTPIVQAGVLQVFGRGWRVPVTPEQLSRVNRKAVVKYFTVTS
jgi:hypothetical protein